MLIDIRTHPAVETATELDSGTVLVFLNPGFQFNPVTRKVRNAQTFESIRDAEDALREIKPH